MPLMIASGASMLGGSIMSSGAGKDAAKDAARAAEAQKRENIAAYGEQKKMLAPWMEAGQTALRDIQVGIREGSFDPGKFHFDAEAMKNDPGYQFRVSEGARLGAQRVGAGGKFFSTQGQKQLAANEQGIASQEYGNAYARAANEHQMEGQRLGQKQNALMQLNQAGQNAANNTATMRGNLAAGQAAQTQNLIGAADAMGQAKAAPWNALAEIGGMGAGYAMSAPSAPASGGGRNSFDPSGFNADYF